MHCNPAFTTPWVILPVVSDFRRQGVSVMCSNHIHSSLLGVSPPPPPSMYSSLLPPPTIIPRYSQYPAVDARLTELFNSKSIPEGDRCAHQLLITVIWGTSEQMARMGCSTVVKPFSGPPIRGQINLLRYLYRLMPQNPYESLPPSELALADQLLDLCDHASRTSWSCATTRPDHTSCRDAAKEVQSIKLVITKRLIIVIMV